MGEELFDLLECTSGKTGRTIAREEAHRIGAWHGAFHCLIIGEREGRWTVLLQKRSLAKTIAPGRIDVSVGGHYAAGEDARTAGPREIKEELGLRVAFDELVPVGRRVFVYCFSPGSTEYEFQDVFLLHRDLDMQSLALQQEELGGVIELDGEEGIALLSGKQPSILTVLMRPDRRREAIRVAAADFVPCVDNYYLKLLLLARRYVRGEREDLVI